MAELIQFDEGGRGRRCGAPNRAVCIDDVVLPPDGSPRVAPTEGIGAHHHVEEQGEREDNEFHHGVGVDDVSSLEGEGRGGSGMERVDA